MRTGLAILAVAAFALVFGLSFNSTSRPVADEIEVEPQPKVAKITAGSLVSAAPIAARAGLSQSLPDLPPEISKSESMLELGISKINQEGATVQSRELFEQSLQINPANGLALTVLVGSYLDLGEQDRGENFLKELSKKFPEHSAMHYAALADLRAYVGDTRGSAEASEIAVELDPKSAVAHSLLGSAYLKEGDPRAKETLQRSSDLFREESRGQSVSPSEKQAASALSEVFFQEGNTRESERVLDEIQK
jgi:tetratricopeptide (TPR) repeat protein